MAGIIALDERLWTEVSARRIRHVYLDAASVGLSHKGGAAAISRWQNALAEQGTIAFDEQAEVECLDNLSSSAASLFNATPGDIAIASSETVLMQSLAWAVMPGAGRRIVTTDITHPSTIYPWKRVCDHTGAGSAGPSAPA